LLKKSKQENWRNYLLSSDSGAVIVHPDCKEVIPLAPEFIIKQDGQSKNDCERNAVKRFFKKLRKDHPRLPLIITEDGLSSNAPHIEAAEKYNLHYILGVKKGDHAFLFNKVEAEKRNLHYFLQYIMGILLVFPYMLKNKF
jgi:ribosome biogenesis protein Tsr3